MNSEAKNGKKVTQAIFIVSENWVFCGEHEMVGDQYVRLRNCYNIRVWGTTQGLGELALKGAQAETVLDFYGVVTLPVAHILGVIECAVEIKPK
jgi:hypothetical protein